MCASVQKCDLGRAFCLFFDKLSPHLHVIVRETFANVVSA